MWVYDKPVDSGYLPFNYINDFSFELQMETILMLMSFAVLLCYVSCWKKIH